MFSRKHGNAPVGFPPDPVTLIGQINVGGEAKRRGSGARTLVNPGTFRGINLYINIFTRKTKCLYLKHVSCFRYNHLVFAG